jgi:hypothetical protein
MFQDKFSLKKETLEEKPSKKSADFGSKKEDLKYSGKDSPDQHYQTRYESTGDDFAQTDTDFGNNTWQHRKTIVDSDKRFYSRRILIFCAISALIIISGIVFNMHWLNTVVLLIIHTILFMVLYLEQVELQESKQAGGSIRKVTPFPNDVFFFNSEQKDIAFILNRNSRRLVGFLAFKILGVPVGIEGNISAFLKNLNMLGIECTYQFNYRPKITLSDVELSTDDQNKELMVRDIVGNIGGTSRKSVEKLKKETLHRVPYDESNASNYIMDIIFSFTAANKYLFNVNEVIAQLTHQLDSYGETAEVSFSENFSHYKIRREYDRGLLDGIQSILSKSIPFVSFNGDAIKPNNQFPNGMAPLGSQHMVSSSAYSKTTTEHETHIITKEKLKAINQKFLNEMMIKRALYHGFLLILANIVLGALGTILPTLLGLVGIVNLFGIILIAANFCIDWFAFSTLTSNKVADRTFFHPFEGIQFYRHSLHPGILYAFLKDQHILFGLKFWALNKLSSYFDFNSGKYIRGLTTMVPQVPVLYSLTCTPLSKSEFVEKYYDSLSVQEQRNLSRDGQVIKDATIEKWLDVRGGIYDTIHIFELFSYVRVEQISDRAFSLISRNLSSHSQSLQSIVLTTLKKSDLYEIDTDSLMLKSFILTSFKSKLYFENGSGLPQIPILTKKLIQFMKLTGEIKKGVEPVLPAEFVIPSSLNSGVLFGFIYNTEVNKSQGMVGLEIDQFYRGVTVAGENEALIDLWNMGIILSGIKIGLPYLIFDFNGTYSSLLYGIKDQPTREKIRLYKIGKNFSMSLFQSENPKKDEEDTYLSAVSECFEIAYCLSGIESTIIKKLMMKLSQSTAINEQIDLAKIHGTLYTLGSNFSRDNLESISTIFDKLNSDKNIYAFRVNNNNAFKFSDVIFGNQTIVIDVSELDIHEKILASLVFVAKMNHYAKVYQTIDLAKLGDGESSASSSQLETETVKHIVCMNEPVELISRPFSPRINPINKFSEMMLSLKNLGFGVMLKCKNIGKAVEQLNSITSNYLALKTTNPEDTRAMYELIGLDDFHNGESDSKFRKSSYQKEYLQKQLLYSAIMKRDDYAYPFPIELNLQPLRMLKRADDDLIRNHMESLGYNPDAAEKNLLKNASKTKLEKDFAKFSILIPKIITFFEEVNVSTDISGLSRKKCLLILKNHVHDTLMSFYGNDALARQLRVEILDICIQHEYLEQNYDSGFEKSANVTPVYRLSAKAHTSIEEYAEKRAKTELVTKVDIVDDNGNILEEDIEGDDFESWNPNVKPRANANANANVKATHGKSNTGGLNASEHKEMRDTLVSENIIYASSDDELDENGEDNGEDEHPSSRNGSKMHSQKLTSSPAISPKDIEEEDSGIDEELLNDQEEETPEDDPLDFIYKDLVKDGLIPREKGTNKKYTGEL